MRGRLLLAESGGINKCADDTADDWSDNRDPSVGKIGVTFARNWQYCMGYARSEIASRIDGITRGTTE